MKTSTFIWPVWLCLLVATACHKETDPSLDIYRLEGSEWVVQRLQNFDLQFEASGTYVLKFGEGSFTINKDLNKCSGEYSYAPEELSINFQSTFCTEVCCDSNFAIAMIKFLGTEVRQYAFIKETLRLSKGEKMLVLQRN